MDYNSSFYTNNKIVKDAIEEIDFIDFAQFETVKYLIF